MNGSDLHSANSMKILAIHLGLVLVRFEKNFKGGLFLYFTHDVSKIDIKNVFTIKGIRKKIIYFYNNFLYFVQGKSYALF